VLVLLRKFYTPLINFRGIILSPGRVKIPFRRESNATQSTIYTTSSILSSHYEIVDFLSNLQWLYYSNFSIFQENTRLFDSRSLFYRFLSTFDASGVEVFRDSTRLTFIPILMCLIWILTIFLEYSQSPEQLSGELQALTLRLQRHRLDRF